MSYRLRTLLLVPVVCAVGLACTRIPVTAWSGAQWVNLTILVVDGGSGVPISGAEVELIHPFDDERPPVRGSTEADGRVVLRHRFYASGVDYLVGSTSHVTFSPFVIRVTAKGCTEFRASLARPDGASYQMATAPPLNLSYPALRPVRISLSRLSGNASGARFAEPPEGLIP
jgi:hypothetical protein